MNKLIFLILSLVLTTTFAKHPSWYPENIPELEAKCIAENQLPPLIRFSLRSVRPYDDPKVHSTFLCLAKALNVYSEEGGLNVDRFTYSYFKSPDQANSKKPMVQECVDKYKSLASAGEMIYRAMVCINENEKDNGKMEMRCSINN